ncbi:MAG: hypothetical protein WDZ72_11780 [Cyclobacteriaceae bacterium]
MKNFKIILFLFFLPLMAHGQQPVYDDRTADPYPYLDYWPVLLLPIFGIVVYRLWKRRKKPNN